MLRRGRGAAFTGGNRSGNAGNTRLLQGQETGFFHPETRRQADGYGTDAGADACVLCKQL